MFHRCVQDNKGLFHNQRTKSDSNYMLINKTAATFLSFSVVVLQTHTFHTSSQRRINSTFNTASTRLSNFLKVVVRCSPFGSFRIVPAWNWKTRQVIDMCLKLNCLSLSAQAENRAFCVDLVNYACMFV